MIFIASSARANSTRLTWCQQWSFILEAIFVALTAVQSLPLLLLSMQNRICNEKLLRVLKIKRSMKRSSLVLQLPTQRPRCSRSLFDILSHALACELQSCTHHQWWYLHSTFFSPFSQGLLSFPGHFGACIELCGYHCCTRASALTSLMEHVG